MGIIEKQATKNIIYSYSGALIGFVTIIFSSHILNPDENGLTRVLLSVSILLSQFSGLGFNSITVRIFPYFRNKNNGHHGYLFYGIIVTLVGFSISLLFYFFFKDQLIESNQNKSKLFADYNLCLMPLTFFTLFFNLFDYYLRACYNSVIGSSSREFYQRIGIIMLLFLFYFKIIDFNIFVYLYVAAVCFPTIVLMYYIIKLKEWHVKPVRGFITKALRNEMIKLSIYSILTGGAGVLISNIDIIMVNQKLGLAKAGIYSIAFYFGTIITIPSRSLQRIALGVVSEASKRNDIAEINTIYKKSCNTQLSIGLLLFIGILVNIKNIMLVLPMEYREGQSVILLVGFGYLVDMATGINYVIIITSKHYRYDGYFMLITLILTIVCNYFLIPIYGIEGSAIATVITISMYNLLRWLFLYFKYNMQPYDKNIVKIILIGSATYLFGYIIPSFENFIIDILIRSAIVGGLFILLILKTEAAPEINNKIRKNLKRLSINL